MKLNDFSEIANAIKNELTLRGGFKFSFSQKFGTTIRLEQNMEHKLNVVSIGFTKYNNYQLDTIAASIAFTDLNKALAKVFPEFTIDSVNIKNSISTRTEGRDSGENICPFIPHELNDEDQILKVCELIETFLKEDAYPFFDNWQTLRDLLPLIDKLNQKDISEIFGGSGVPEKALTWYLCDHPEKENFINSWIDKYESKVQKNPDEGAYKEHLERLLSVKQAAISIKPLST